MEWMLTFPWPQAMAMITCIAYLVRITSQYAVERKMLEGMLTREEYERDQHKRHRDWLDDARQMILDLRR